MSADQAAKMSDGSSVEHAAGSVQVAARSAELLAIHQLAIWKRTDRLFGWLLIFEWVASVVIALALSPTTWEGAKSAVHPHVWQALALGAAIVAMPVYLAMAFPGRTITRHVVAVSQMLMSALLIHVGGGRIEMHFHVFGSLAFIAFYRDWRLLISASAIVAADHLLRGMFMPLSVYGILAPSNWRWLEHAVWVLFEDAFLIASCAQGVREMREIAERRALLEHNHAIVEQKVRERTQQLEEAQQNLVKVARSAGMAEIATSVLHNVGNVLNSVNVSVRVAATRVQQSPVENLRKAVQLMTEHQPDLGTFLTQDERGRHVPGYLRTVADMLATEQTAVLEEMASLERNVEHIKHIVNLQQSHAKPADVTESLNLKDLVDDALGINISGEAAKNITIQRDYGAMPSIRADKHVVLQILVNLVSNAKHAVIGNGKADKQIAIRTSRVTHDGQDFLRLDISDNGVGIEPGNLQRIFNHGFTTKKDGHGFGLHSSANNAKRLGGSLSAASDGAGTGATFTLELPLAMEPVLT